VAKSILESGQRKIENIGFLAECNRALQKFLVKYVPFGWCLQLLSCDVQGLVNDGINLAGIKRILELEDVNRVLSEELTNLRSQLAGPLVTAPAPA
jgi:hypothetical protein